MKKFIVLIIFFFIFNITSNCYANQLYKIKIEGNNRITKNTILDKINFEKTKRYSIDEINNFQKILYKTNFFKNIIIKIEGDTLVLKVTENPIINFYYIDGVINKSRLDFINNNVLLNGNKFFTETDLKKDLEMINQTYRNSGYLNVKINPVITEIDNNAINLIIKIDRGEKYLVKRIYFIGNENFSNSTLLDVISTSEHGWWKFLSSSSSLDSNRIEYDKNLLKNFYLNNGYFDVQIVSSDVNIGDLKNIEVIFSINSGPLYSFNNFLINDNLKNLNELDIQNIKKILKKILKGNYSKEKVLFTKTLIFDYLNLQKIEFVDFDIFPKKNQNNKIDIVYNFKKTNKKFINLVNISGNTITEESVIRQNIIFSEGDTLVDYKKTTSFDNLKNTGIFKNVEIKEKKISQELVDLDIVVEEQPTGSISAGLGIGSSSSSVNTGIIERNLFGKGIVANSNVSVGTEKIIGKADFKFPDFYNTGNDFFYSAFATQLDYKNAGYESSNYGNDISIKYEPHEDIFLRPGFGIDIDKIDTNASTSSLYKNKDGNYLTFKSFYDLSTDKRNRKFNPSSGYIAGFGQTLAIPGSDISYIKNNIYGSRYFPISKNFIVNLKGGATSINSFNDDVKLSDRLFLSNSKLRGFESFGVGPKDNNDHIGGNYSAYSSISSTFPNFLPEKWNANSIIFLDTGNVWGVDFNDTLDNNKGRSSTGLAFDWISPLGPLSFVFSQVISSSSGDLEESFNFKLGSSF